jgi:outer membrane protein assembly factor BamB
MKTTILTVLLASFFMMAKAQEDMPVVWETKLGHSIAHTGTGMEDRGYSYAASEKEITVFKNEDGSTIWTKAFKEMAPKLRKVDELIPFWESNTIFLFDRKTGKDQIACIDIETGELLWNTDKYQKVTEDVVIYIPEEDGFAISLKKELVFIKARTGEELWSTTKFKGVVGRYIYIPDERAMVTVNFVPGGLAAFFTGFKNQIAKFNLKNGDIIWESTYIGRAEKKIWSREFVYDLNVEGDKLFLLLGGMQVYDLNTGANLWSAAYDFTADGIVKGPQGTRKMGVYRAVAQPVIDGDDIYVLDMTSKKSQYVKKYDLHTGKLLWTSKEIKGARAIPGMQVINDKIALQIGGKVEVQYYRVYKAGDYTISEWGVFFPDVKPFGVQALNTSDGTLAWESEKFKKGITNGISVGDNHIICSGKALYSLDIATGKDNFEVPVSKGGVGLAELIMPFEDDVIIVVGEKGVSTFSASTGELLNTGKYKKSKLEARDNELVVMKTDKADIACFDVNTCKYKEFKAKKGAVTSLSEDGEHVYVYEKKVMTKLKTR